MIIELLRQYSRHRIAVPVGSALLVIEKTSACTAMVGKARYRDSYAFRRPQFVSAPNPSHHSSTPSQVHNYTPPTVITYLPLVLTLSWVCSDLRVNILNQILSWFSRSDIFISSISFDCYTKCSQHFSHNNYYEQYF